MSLRLVGASATSPNISRRDRRILQEASRLHHDLNTATEALRQALGNRDADDILHCSRRLFAVGLMFGDLVRKNGGEL